MKGDGSMTHFKLLIDKICASERVNMWIPSKIAEKGDMIMIIHVANNMLNNEVLIHTFNETNNEHVCIPLKSGTIK